MPFFRRNKQWQPVGDFPTSSVQRLPFQRPDDDENTIIYTTRYEDENPDECGIFEYNFKTKENRAILLWQDCDYFPRWDTSVYNASDDTILIVGGANVHDEHKRYDLLVTFNLTTNQLTKRDFPPLVGGNARVCLSDKGRSLHIFGGTSNYHHVRYDLDTETVSYLHSFYSSYSQIQSCGFVHSSSVQSLYIFGGRSSFDRRRQPEPPLRTIYEDFWTFDLNHPLARLSMRDAAWFLINGWMGEQFELDYPIELNDVIIKFLGIGNSIYIWEKNEKWALPKPMYQFGNVLYKDRVLIVFGGREKGNVVMDDIFYLDLTDPTTGWQQSRLKCPQPGTYNCTVIDDTVHMMPFYTNIDHYTIPVKGLLPSKLIKKIERILDVEKETRIQLVTQSDTDISVEYREMLRVQLRHLRNWVALSVLIGLLLVTIGVLLCYTNIPRVLGVGVVGLGAVVICGALLYGRMYRPSQAEYLLF